MRNTAGRHNPGESISDQIEKVTAFVTRRTLGGEELLLFKHPSAGIQIPAGSVEKGEEPEAAALREAWEETGLNNLTVSRYLGWRDDPPSPGYGVIGEGTNVHARPDLTSFKGAHLPRGWTVKLEQAADGYLQVTYREWDQLLEHARFLGGEIPWEKHHRFALLMSGCCN